MTINKHAKAQMKTIGNWGKEVGVLQLQDPELSEKLLNKNVKYDR